MYLLKTDSVRTEITDTLLSKGRGRTGDLTDGMSRRMMFGVMSVHTVSCLCVGRPEGLGPDHSFKGLESVSAVEEILFSVQGRERNERCFFCCVRNVRRNLKSPFCLV